MRFDSLNVTLEGPTWADAVVAIAAPVAAVPAKRKKSRRPMPLFLFMVIDLSL
jgi:hypothetical protein